MDFFELIKYRESVRDYDPGHPLSENVILKILSAGNIAPSAGNRQPWEFIVVSSAENLAGIKNCYDKPWFKAAPHVLVVKGFKDHSWVHPKSGYNSIETDLAIAMDHIILAAANEGVGTCWIIAFDPDCLKQALMLKENEVVDSITPLGYPNQGYQHREKNRKELDNIVRFL